MVFAGAPQQGVDVAVIELARLGFELFPVNGSGDGVGVEIGRTFPNLREFGWPSAGIVHLSAEDEVGLAAEEEGPSAVFVDEFWSLGSEREVAGYHGHKKEKQRTENEHESHLGVNIRAEVKRFK